MVALKVFGAGYPRTASLSLKIALEQLGFGPCHHMTEVFPRPERWQYWVDASQGKPVDWDTVFEGFVSSSDAPACFFFKEITARYPDAKVILSVRDADKWADSAANTAMGLVMRDGVVGTPMGDWLDKTFYFRIGDALGDADRLKRFYAEHNDAVMATVPAEQLLVYEVGSGWEPLCEFLGVPVPDEPYPRVNDRMQFSDIARGASKMAHEAK
jgi:Sulfotransferase domain